TYYVSTNEICAEPPVAVNVYVHVVPVIDLGPDSVVVSSGQVITLSPGQGFSAYQWSNGQTTFEIPVSTPGSYSVIVTDNNGCTATDRIFVNMPTFVNTVFENGELILYPNPARGQFTIEFSKITAKILTLKLISSEGKIVKNEEVNLSNGQLKKAMSLEGISQGVYFMEISSDHFTEAIKVFVE